MSETNELPAAFTAVRKETIERAVESALVFISPDHRQKLTESTWLSSEYRGSEIVPDFNVFFVNGFEDSLEIMGVVKDRAERMAEFLGNNKDDGLKPASIYIDPFSDEYNCVDAFYLSSSSSIWVKSSSYNSLSHEIAHWLTCSGLGEPDHILGTLLVVGGFANWVALNYPGSDAGEKPGERWVKEKIIDFDGYDLASEISLDFVNEIGAEKISPAVIYPLGTLLFDVLAERENLNVKKIRENFRLVKNSVSVTDWLSRSGYSKEDIKDIELRWKQKIIDQNSRLHKELEQRRSEIRNTMMKGMSLSLKHTRSRPSS